MKNRMHVCAFSTLLVAQSSSAQTLTSVAEHVGWTTPNTWLGVVDTTPDMRTIVGNIVPDLNNGQTSIGFKWNANSGLVILPLPDGAVSVFIRKVSNYGDVLFVSTYDAPLGEHTNLRHFLWTESSGFAQLFVQNNDDKLQLHSMSGDGTMLIGTRFTMTLPGAFARPFRWSQTNGVDFLRADFPEDYAIATLVNTDGNVIVGEEWTGPFRWTATGGFQMLPPLQGWPYPTPAGASPTWMSSDGNVICGNVTFAIPEGWSSRGCFRWTQETGTQYIELQQLSTLGRTLLAGASQDGQWFFGSGGTDETNPDTGNAHAYLWRADGSAIDLDAYFAAQSLHPDWTLLGTHFMNDDHRQIIGERFDGEQRIYWIATLPENFPCDSIDFNGDSNLFDPRDIEAFLSVYSEGPCMPASATCNDVDFNNDTSIYDPCDIGAFLVMYSEGPCTPCGM